MQSVAYYYYHSHSKFYPKTPTYQDYWQREHSLSVVKFSCLGERLRETRRNYSPAAILQSLVSHISTVCQGTTLLNNHMLAKPVVNCECFMVVTSTPRQTHVL